MLTRDQVKALTGDADRWLAPLNNALIRWEITSHAQVTMFLAQCAHESGGFKRLVENLHYSAAALLAAWPKRFTGEDAVAMAYDEQRIAERAYGGRMGNGAEGSGDGYRYRGRGIIQLTGRDNYQRAGDAIGLDFVAQPELLEQPDWAASSAGWFWATNGCGALADAGDYLGVTKRINGGVNGYDDRQAWLKKVLAILPAPTAGTQPAVPIEDHSTIYQPEAPVANPVETVAGIASIFNPAIGGVIGLAGQVFKAFQPALQAKVAKEIDRRVKDPTISGPAAAELVNGLASTVLSQAKVLTGQTDDFKAVAALTADPAQAANLKLVEASVSAQLEDLIKAGNAASTWDQARWTAQNTGKQTVSSIAIEEKKAGVYDMTRLLAWAAVVVVTLISFLLVVAIVVQSMSWVFGAKEAKGIDPVLLALAGPLLTLAFKGWQAILDYRFDGTKDSTAQSQALISAAQRNGGMP